MMNKITDRLRICCNDGKIFAKVHVFDSAVHDKGLCEKAGKRIKTGCKIENKKRT